MPSKLLKSLWILLRPPRPPRPAAAARRRSRSGRAGLRPPRRVFFITVDTLRADHMSLYGYPRATSPSLAKLAATGVTFDQRDLPVAEDGQLVRGDVHRPLSAHDGPHPQGGPAHPGRPYLTLPEFFKEQGYQTFGVVSNAVLAAQFGWNTGFDEFQETWGGGDFPEDPKAFRPLASATRVNDARPAAAAEVRQGRQLFAWIHYSDPHAPYILPEGASESVPGRRDVPRTRRPCDPGPADHQGIRPRTGTPTSSTTSPSTTRTSWWRTRYIQQTAGRDALAGAPRGQPDRLHRRPRREPGGAQLLVRARAAALQHHGPRAAVLRAWNGLPAGPPDGPAGGADRPLSDPARADRAGPPGPRPRGEEPVAA